MRAPLKGAGVVTGVPLPDALTSVVSRSPSATVTLGGSGVVLGSRPEGTSWVDCASLAMVMAITLIGSVSAHPPTRRDEPVKDEASAPTGRSVSRVGTGG